jgi:hypothetical protein
MTAEQTAAAKEFLGMTFTKTWVNKSDPRIGARPSEPTNFVLLDAKDVRTELRFTDEQQKTLVTLRDKWTKLESSRLADLPPKEAHAQATELIIETEKALAATLKPEQAARLKQIAFQLQLVQFDGFPRPGPSEFPIDRYYTNATLARELALTEAQVTKIQAAWDSYQTDVATALEKADTSANAEKRLKELAVLRRAKAQETLTKAQTVKLDELIGKPFTGSTRRDRPTRPPFGPDGPFGPGRPGLAMELRREAAFGKYTTELTLLMNNKSIQEDLKLTADQLKKVVEAQADILSKYRPLVTDTPEVYAKTYAERSKAVEGALS